MNSKTLLLALTNDRKEENGKPPSRAKDQIWRDAVATSVMLAAVSVTIRTVTITSVAAKLFVVL